MLQQEFSEAKKKLSLSQLYVQQLGNAQLHQEKSLLEKNAAEYKDNVKHLGPEKLLMPTAN